VGADVFFWRVYVAGVAPPLVIVMALGLCAKVQVLPSPPSLYLASVYQDPQLSTRRHPGCTTLACKTVTIVVDSLQRNCLCVRHAMPRWTVTMHAS
jgi:hypothetical protein